MPDHRLDPRRLARHRPRIRAPVPARDGWPRASPPRATTRATRSALAGGSARRRCSSTSPTPDRIGGLGWQLDGEKLDVARVRGRRLSAPRRRRPQPPTAAGLRPRDAHQCAGRDAGDAAWSRRWWKRRSGKLRLHQQRHGQHRRRVASSYGWLYRASKAALNMAVAARAARLSAGATCVAMQPGLGAAPTWAAPARRSTVERQRRLACAATLAALHAPAQRQLSSTTTASRSRPGEPQRR